MAAGRALDYCAGVLAEAAAAGAAPVIFGDRWQYLGEMPGLAVGLEFLRRDQIASLVNVSLEHRECGPSSDLAQPPITFIINARFEMPG